MGQEKQSVDYKIFFLNLFFILHPSNNCRVSLFLYKSVS